MGRNHAKYAVSAVLSAQLLCFMTSCLYGAESLQDLNKLDTDHWLKAALKHLARSDTAGTADCSAHYGMNYIHRWRALAGVYCNNSKPAVQHPGSVPAAPSTVDCYAHPEADISVCSVRNVLLASSLDFLGAENSGIHELPNPKPGSILLACQYTRDAVTFLRGRLQTNEGSRMWLVQAPKFVSSSTAADAVTYERMQQSCSPSRRIQHPVLILTRVDPENAFHNLEGLVSVFAALAVVQQQIPMQAFRQGLEVVVADDRLPGFFLDIWRRVSHPFPLRLLRQQPYPDDTCFSNLLLAPYTAHTQSLLTYQSGDADEVLCESVILQAVSIWLRHLFRDLLPADLTLGLVDKTSRRADSSQGSSLSPTVADVSRVSAYRPSNDPAHSVRHHTHPASLDLAQIWPTVTQSQPPLQQLNVLWLSRSRFEQQHQAQLTAWQRARQLTPEQQVLLVVELQRAVLLWNQQTCVPGAKQGCIDRSVMFTLQVAELSELPFYPDQISLLMRTGVLIGVHGAGLANQIYMQPRMGAVLELWHNMDSNYHYHNMAHMLGHKFCNVRSEQQLDVDGVLKQLQVAMDAVASAHAAAAATAARGSWWKRGWGR